MARSWLRRILITCAVFALVATVLPWVLGNFVILAAGSGEHVSVRKTGMVTCPEALQWSAWTNGAGDLHRGQFAEGIDANTTIIAHRIGTDSKLFAILTMYQAKYEHSDGHVETWAANGPRPIVSVNESAATICSGVFLTAGVIGLIVASRFKK